MAGAEEPQECQDRPLPVPDPLQGHQRATLQGSQLPSPRKWTSQNRQAGGKGNLKHQNDFGHCDEPYGWHNSALPPPPGLKSASSCPLAVSSMQADVGPLIPFFFLIKREKQGGERGTVKERVLKQAPSPVRGPM